MPLAKLICFCIPYFWRTKPKSTKTITARCFSCENKSVCQTLPRSCTKAFSCVYNWIFSLCQAWNRVLNLTITISQVIRTPVTPFTGTVSQELLQGTLLIKLVKHHIRLPVSRKAISLGQNKRASLKMTGIWLLYLLSNKVDFYLHAKLEIKRKIFQRRRKMRKMCPLILLPPPTPPTVKLL